MEKVTEQGKDSKDSKVGLDLLANTIPQFDPSTETYWAACAWLMTQAENGLVTMLFAKQRISAVKALASIFEKPPTVVELKATLHDPTYKARWINSREQRGLVNRKTIDTYITRTDYVLGEYIERSIPNKIYDQTRLTRYTMKTEVKAVSKSVKTNGNGHSNGNGQHKPLPPPPAPVAPAEEPGVSELVVNLGAEGVAHVRLPFDTSKLKVSHVTEILLQMTALMEFKATDAGLIGAKLVSKSIDFDPTKAAAQQMFAS